MPDEASGLSPWASTRPLDASVIPLPGPRSRAIHERRLEAVSIAAEIIACHWGGKGPPARRPGRAHSLSLSKAADI